MFTETLFGIFFSVIGRCSLVVISHWQQGKRPKIYLSQGGFRYDFTESQAASYKHFQCQNRCLSSVSPSVHSSTVVLFWQRPNPAALATSCRTIRVLHFFQWNSPVIFKALFTPDGCCSVSGGLQRDVVYLGWSIAPSSMNPNAGGGGSCGVSANEYSCTQEPK